MSGSSGTNLIDLGKNRSGSATKTVHILSRVHLGSVDLLLIASSYRSRSKAARLPGCPLSQPFALWMIFKATEEGVVDPASSTISLYDEAGCFTALTCSLDAIGFELGDL